MSGAPDAAPTPPACAVRGMLDPSGRVRIVTRNLRFDAEGQTSLPAEADHPSALDLLVAALATDLLAGLRRAAARAGLALHDAELSLAARLDNPLVALGVVGEDGSPGLAALRGALYVHTEASERTLETLWGQVLAHAPVYATLCRAAHVRIDLKPIP